MSESAGRLVIPMGLFHHVLSTLPVSDIGYGLDLPQPVCMFA